MSDISFNGAAELLAVLIGIGLVLVSMVLVPIAMNVMGKFGVRISETVRKAARGIMIALGMLLAGLVVEAVVLLNH